MKLPIIRNFVDGSDRTDFTNDYSTTNADAAVLSVPSGISHLEIDELAFAFVFEAAAPDYAVFLGDSALSNGISVKMYDATPTELADLTDDTPIKDTEALYARSNAPLILMEQGAYSPVQQEGVCIWKFNEPLILRYGHTLEVEFSDDLSNAANIRFSITARGRSVS